MSLADEVHAQKRMRGPRCTVLLLLEQLDGAERQEVEEGIANEDLPLSQLQRALDARGYRVNGEPLGREPIRRHRDAHHNRSGGCGCFKS